MIDNFDNGFVKCIDDFLPKYTFNRLQNFVLGIDFPWHWSDFDYNPQDPTITKVDTKDVGTFMLHNVLLTPKGPTSDMYRNFFPITDALHEHNVPIGEPLKWKLNLYTNQNKVKYLAKHTDFYETTNNNFEYITGILCFTSDNGASIIGDKEFETKENRLILFDGNLVHSAFTQTDKDRRVIMNINYMRKK